MGLPRRSPLLPDWTTLKEWSGNGPKETETFQTETAEWRVNWSNAGGFLSVTVYDDGGKMVSLAANTKDEGKDTSYVHKKGRFYLKINATGKWSISVEENR